MAFTTRRSLLMKVRNGDEVSWSEFYTAYCPLIRLCGRDFSLSTAECDELVRQVMIEIFRKDILGRFDFDRVPDDAVFRFPPSRGRFRHYLRGIVRHHALHILRRRKPGADREVPEAFPAPDDWEKTWDGEWKRHLLNMALEELKNRVAPETFVAFEMYALQELPAAEVAEFLNFSLSSVYTAKSRCAATLREIIAELEES